VCGGALAAIVLGATLADPIAAAVRHTFAAITPNRFLVLFGVMLALSVLLARVKPSPRTADLRWTTGAWPVGVSLAAATAGVIWYSLGRAVVVPSIFADELIHAQAARKLASYGSLAPHGYGAVTPVVDAVAYLVTNSDVTAYRVVQGINVVAMATAAFIAYPLSRRALSPGWSLVVAALALVIPWLTYARFALTEPDFYPVLLLFALCLVRALECPTWSRQLIVLVSLGFAYLTRTQAVSLVGAVIVAVPLFGVGAGSVRAALRAFAPTWIVYIVAGAGAGLSDLLGLWSPLGPYRTLIDGFGHPHGLAIWAAANLSALFLGLGVLTGFAAPLGAAMLLRREAERSGAALAAVTVGTTAALLASVTLLSESIYGQGSVHERDLFFAAPLIIACALWWATNGCPRPRILTGLIVIGVLGATQLIPVGAVNAHLFDALSFKVWARITVGSISPKQWFMLATAAAALVVLLVRSPWPFVATVGLAAVAVAAASDYRSVESRSQADRYAWVDAAVPNNADVTLLFAGDPTGRCRSASPIPRMFVYTEYFNSRVRRFGHVYGDDAARGLATERFAIRGDGTVTSSGRGLRSRYVVTDARLEIVGRPAGSLPARRVVPSDHGVPRGRLTLWKVDGVVRLRRPAQALQVARVVC
jgi:hypothetical protein